MVGRSLLVGAAIVLICAVVRWIFQPTIHYFQSTNVNTMTLIDYTLYDRYSSNEVSKHVVGLSVIVPAYNEELRLPIMLDEAFAYLSTWAANNQKTYEIVVVDDGSTDGTADVVRKYIETHPEQLRLLRLHANAGKGAALKMGVRESLGNVILIADADGATDIRDLDRLLPALESSAVPVRGAPSAFAEDGNGNGPAAGSVESIGDKLGMIVGSRAHLAKDSIAKREFYRTVLMKGFHLYVQALVTSSVQDTQCGFKLFTRRAGKALFGTMHLYRWAFDTELIFLAEWLGVPIQEIPVTWHEVDGSKLIRSKMDVVTTSITMARDILCMRLSYLLGLWEFPSVAPRTTNADTDSEL